MLKVCVLTLLLLALCSCGSQEREYSREEAIHSGVRLMEEEQYDEAIAYFQELYQKDPHPQIQQVWASVYAARAGIRVRNLVGLAKELTKVSGLSEEKNVVSFLQKIKSSWKFIPSVDEVGAKDLDQAVKVLSARKPEVRLYAAVLRGIRIKSLLEKAPTGNSRQPLCGANAEKISSWVAQVYSHMKYVYADLESATPSQSEQLQKLQLEVQQIQVHLHQADLREVKPCP